MAIIHEDKFHKESNYTRELVRAYDDYIQQVPKEIAQNHLKFLKYLSSEFSKEEINQHYNYMVSALFSEISVEMGFDGVIYPSVRAAGKGFNIALTPTATRKMKLIVAGECSVVKYDGTIYLGNDKIALLSGEETEEQTFEMKPLPYGLNHILKKLGLKDIEGLKDS